MKVFQGLFDAALFADLQRLPELFCGFQRRPGEGPTLYPVACNPQAWASASIFMLITACLGIKVRAKSPEVIFNKPILPPFLEWLELRNLSTSKGTIGIRIQKEEKGVTVNVLERDGDARISVIL